MKTLESILDADLDLDITVMVDFLQRYLEKPIRTRELMKWTQKMHRAYEFQPNLKTMPHSMARVSIHQFDGVAMVRIVYWSDKKNAWADADIFGGKKKIVIMSILFTGINFHDQMNINFAVPCNQIQKYINKAEGRL